MEYPTPGKNRAPSRLIFGALLLMSPGFALRAAAIVEEDWITPVSAMALPRGTTLARSNVVRVLLQSFSSNVTVKAFIVLPGVIDDLYLVHRDASPLNIDARNVAEALLTLTNRTSSRLLFTNSVLLWRTDSDRSAPEFRRIAKSPIPESWEQECSLPRVLWVDAHWQGAQPVLKKGMRITLRPNATAEEAWHFERVNLAANGLSNLDLLQAVALSTGTRVVIRKRTVAFEH